jgi:hypothetical protein
VSLHNHLVYTTVNVFFKDRAEDYGKRGAFFDGEKWIDIETGEVYNTIEEAYQKHKVIL